MEMIFSMPTALHDKGSRLLKARKSHRPADTLPFLAQCLLHWQVISIGVPSFSLDSLEAMARDFRSIGCDTAPTKLPKWSEEETGLAISVLGDLWKWLLTREPIPLPVWKDKLEEGEYPVLLDWIWSHCDFHFMTLTMGLMGTGLLTDDTKDPRYKNQKPFLDFMMKVFGMLVPMADALGKASNDRMPVGEALLVSSVMLDSVAEALESRFQDFGPQGLLLARSGGWHRPVYPFKANDLLPKKAPRKPRAGKTKTKP